MIFKGPPSIPKMVKNTQPRKWAFFYNNRMHSGLINPKKVLFLNFWPQRNHGWVWLSFVFPIGWVESIKIWFEPFKLLPRPSTLGQIHKNYFTFGLNWYIMLFKKRKTYFSRTFILSDLLNFWFKDFWISAVHHFVSQWGGWGETKLWHFSQSRVFLVLKLL